MAKKVESKYPPQRQPNGMILHHTTPKKPTQRVLKMHQVAAERNIAAGRIVALCPLCKSDTGVPSSVSSIRDKGVCVLCDQYLRGLSECVVLYVEPTYKQAKERYDQGLPLGSFEVAALVDEIGRLAAEVEELQSDKRQLENDLDELRCQL